MHYTQVNKANKISDKWFIFHVSRIIKIEYDYRVLQIISNVNRSYVYYNFIEYLAIYEIADRIL